MASLTEAQELARDWRDLEIVRRRARGESALGVAQMAGTTEAHVRATVSRIMRQDIAASAPGESEAAIRAAYRP